MTGASSSSSRYVYGIVSADDGLEFEAEAVGGAGQVYPIRYRGLAALVSNVEEDAGAFERSDEDATRHDDVVREILLRDGGRTVIPMRYGMIFERDRALTNVLRASRPTLRRTLRELDGALELGVKLVRGEGQSVEQSAVEETVDRTLDPSSERWVENDQFSDRLVLNRSYLVDREARDHFDEGIEALSQERDDLKIRYSGPFAPYSFVDIQIGGR